jgi:hypothetical protein
MSSFNPRLLGYDVRLSAEDYLEANWDAERRALYLLRPTVEWPLSVDTLVWPSVFFSKVYGSQAPIRVDPGVELRGWWLRLEEMRAAFKAGWKGSTPGVPVAITVFPRDGFGDSYPVGSVLETESLPEPPESPRGGRFLGFDVADASLISGLCGCGYGSDEAAEWRASWEMHLNQFGLIDTLDAALRFRSATDERVREHAPFYVFGISRLPG